MKIHHHYKSKLLWFFPKWVKAFTLGNHIFFRNEKTKVSQWLIDHELEHVKQYKEHGIIKFLYIYFIKEWNVPYRQKTFEKEAYQKQGVNHV